MSKHKKLVNKFLRLNEQQSEDTVVNEVLTSLKLKMKVCVRFVCRIEKDFIILKDSYGSKHSTKIFIGWVGSHFFLAKRNLQPVSFEVVKDRPSHSNNVATTFKILKNVIPTLRKISSNVKINFQESDFGTPPDTPDFMEVDDPFLQEGPSPPF